MLTKITPEFIPTVKEIETLLVSKNYTALSSGGRMNKLSNEEVEKAIKSYGGSVTERPDDTLSDLQLIKIEGNDFETYYVDYDLYIDGNQSDLTLSLLITNQSGNYITSIEDLHVL